MYKGERKNRNKKIYVREKEYSFSLNDVCISQQHIFQVGSCALKYSENTLLMKCILRTNVPLGEDGRRSQVEMVEMA